MRKFYLPMLMLVVLSLCLSGIALADKESVEAEKSASSQAESSWYCPWGGRWMGHGQGMPHGGRGYHMRGYCPMWRGNPAPLPESLTKEQAHNMVKEHIARNPNLKAGAVEEKDGYYQVDILTKKGELVDKIQIDKNTGWFRSIY